MTEPRWSPPGPALLFAPADRPDRFAKAAARADAVILDLEDGAASADPAAKRAAVAGAAETAGLDPARVIVRITGPGEPTFAGDLAMVRDSPFDTVIVPKLGAEVPGELAGLKVIALVETAAALLNLAGIAAHPDVVALYWGADDLAAGLGGDSSRRGPGEPAPGTYRDPQRLARTCTLVHAAAAGIPAIDAVWADFSDPEGQYAEARDAAGCGFAAVACIHPATAAAVRRAYAPSAAQLARARRILDAAGAAVGAFTVDGAMVDAPVVAQARITVARARAAGMAG